MGAIGGQMTNIDPSTGETSMMFHAVPHILSHDPHSGDYGLGLFGNALESGSYFVLDPALGALCFLCSLTTTNSNSTFAAQTLSEAVGAEEATTAALKLIPRDAYRIAVYLEPLGLYINSQCGTIDSIDLPAGALAGPPVALREPQGSSNYAAADSLAAVTTERSFSVSFAASPHCARLRLTLTKTARMRHGSAFAVKGASQVRGAWEIKPNTAAGDATTVHVAYTV